LAVNDFVNTVGSMEGPDLLLLESELGGADKRE